MKTKLVNLLAWAQTPAGKIVLHRLATALIAAYVALHRAGV